MLTKNQDAGQASADVRRPPRKGARVRSSAAVIEIINEPKPNWVLLLNAPFYCFSGRYIPSAQEWADAFQAEVRKITQSDEFKDGLRKAIRDVLKARGMEQYSGPDTPLELLGYRFPPVEWSFKSSTNEDEKPHAYITAMDVQTQIWPGSVFVTPWHETHNIINLGEWLIGGTSNEILSDQEWNEALRIPSEHEDEDGFVVGYEEISRDQKIAAEWHRQLLKRLFWSWERNFAQALESGAAHIMARKGSVLAPFERITWNQWQYFRLEQLAPPQEKWGDPKLRSWERDDLPSTACGPTDERLYEIHIAPGVNKGDRSRKNDPEKKCLQWLVELIHDYPDRQPKRRDLLAQEAVSKFPRLTLNRFLRCWTLAQEQTQNHNWSQAGRLKSRQNSRQ
jgi:hypothetical protein